MLHLLSSAFDLYLRDGLVLPFEGTAAEFTAMCSHLGLLVAHYDSGPKIIMHAFQAQAAAAAGVRVEQYQYVFGNQIDYLDTSLKNNASAIELQGTLAFCASKEVLDAHGPLCKINSGRNVLFKYKNNSYVEVDGLALGNNVLFVFELKSTINMGMSVAQAPLSSLTLHTIFSVPDRFLSILLNCCCQFGFVYRCHYLDCCF